MQSNLISVHKEEATSSLFWTLIYHLKITKYMPRLIIFQHVKAFSWNWSRTNASERKLFFVANEYIFAIRQKN